MLKKYIILLWLSFVKINCQMTSFNPKQRTVHTATLIGDKLYILGGSSVPKQDYLREFFYLDFSVTFNTQKLLWKDLSSINTVPPHGNAASVKGGANNSTLFLYGGDYDDTNIEPELVYTFDTQSNTWSTLTIAGVSAIRKAHFTGIIDYNGKMYLWGGMNVTNINSPNSVNDMTILDTINLNWGKGSLVNAPSPRTHYGAVLLPDNNIIYMGGFNLENDEELPLDQIYIYNTISDRWDKKTATGIVPSPRDAFSAVLGLDGQSAIIFGGSATIHLTTYIPLADSLYTLNLTNYKWSINKSSGNFPNSRMYHKANVIGKYMVISFGKGYDQSVESDILLLDISNNEEYIWTTTFDPKFDIIPSPSPSLPSSQPPPNKAIIGVIIGSLFGGLLLLFGGFFLYKWHKNRLAQKITFHHGCDYFY